MESAASSSLSVSLALFGCLSDRIAFKPHGLPTLDPRRRTNETREKKETNQTERAHSKPQEGRLTCTESPLGASLICERAIGFGERRGGGRASPPIISERKMVGRQLISLAHSGWMNVRKSVPIIYRKRMLGYLLLLLLLLGPVVQ